MDNKFYRKAFPLLAAGVLLGGLTILFWKVVFQGYVPLAADLVFSDPVWKPVAPLSYTHPQNPLLGDTIAQFYIWQDLARQGILDNGKLPLWNPYEFSGQPLLGNAQSALYYPPNLFLLFLNVANVTSLRLIFNLFIAGWFTFLFCRKLGASAEGSLIAGIAFMFSGPMIVWSNFPHSNVFAWLPFLMWAGESLLIERQKLLWSMVAALGIGMIFLGGHPESTFHVGFLFLVYVLLRGIWLRSRLKIFSWIGLAILVGVLIGSIQWLPFLEFVRLSSTLAEGGRSMGGDSLFYSKDWLQNLTLLITLFYPNFFGNPITNNYNWPFQSYQNYNEQAVYFGLVPLALAFGSFFIRKQKTSRVILAVMALFCIGVALRLPGFEVFNHLPLFSIALNKRLKIGFTFFAACLAGFGAEGVWLYLSQRAREYRKTFWIFLAILLVNLSIFGLIYLLKLAHISELSGFAFWQHTISIFSRSQLRTVGSFFVALLCLGLAGAALKVNRVQNHFMKILVVLTLGELIVLAWGYTPIIKETDIFPTAPVIEYLKQEHEPFRFISQNALQVNYGAGQRLAQIGGYDLPVYGRFSDLYRASGGQGRSDYQLWQPDWLLVDWLNIKYVVIPGDLNLPKYRLVYEFQGVKVYENMQVLPRAYMVYTVDVANDDAEVLNLMTSGSYDFKQRVILSEPLPAQISGLVKNFPIESPGARVDFEFYRNDSVSASVFTSNPGLFVMSDILYPGWIARVDGIVTPIYQANYAYRAIFVPEGLHRVEFQYLPATFQVGKSLTIVGLIVLSICAIYLILLSKLVSAFI